MLFDMSFLNVNNLINDNKTQHFSYDISIRVLAMYNMYRKSRKSNYFKGNEHRTDA